MREIDGASGGGQQVRTAVATSAVTGDAVTVENVRGGRSDPGLKAQHVAAIESVAALSDATTEDVAIGSSSFSFDPGGLPGGRHEQSIGTAGSVTLVVEAVLPLVLGLEGPADLAVTGGTDVPWSPPFDYLRAVTLPVLAGAGLSAEVSLDRRGFYPSGKGRTRLHLEPSSVSPLRLDRRGDLESIAVHSVASASLADAAVADRQADAVLEGLEGRMTAPIQSAAAYPETTDPGSVVVIVARFERSIAGFSALGERGKPAEAVAGDAVARFATFRETDAAVDRHLADQVVPFLAFAGGSVRVPTVTDHVETHLDVLDQFGFDVAIDPHDEGATIAADPPDQTTP
ncbi:MAG: RNA 3'-terminal phosphate cyclase [Halanaeroarchaeum sp.]